MHEKWLIWSNEQERWWLGSCHGYTTDPKEAGRFTIEEAYRICCDGNQHAWLKIKRFGVIFNQPHETMVPESSLPK